MLVVGITVCILNGSGLPFISTLTQPRVLRLSAGENSIQQSPEPECFVSSTMLSGSLAILKIYVVAELEVNISNGE